MGVKIENTADGAVHVVACNYCGTRMHAARDGNYEWAAVSTAAGERMGVDVLGRRCSPAHEAQHGIALDSMELAMLVEWSVEDFPSHP